MLERSHGLALILLAVGLSACSLSEQASTNSGSQPQGSGIEQLATYIDNLPNLVDHNRQWQTLAGRYFNVGV